ncbi:MAG TPA: NAD-dependent epimerase/dehydratase family protein [Caulobacterales bacterium]|nr:NAD-dependent epimerase/dehydratase family protein [Caulobacterales bacterium]
MRIFITGASGFVGGAATRKLLASGHQVRAMSRSEKSDAAIRALGAEPVRCDLENVSATHVGDAEALVHCAAFVEQWGPRDAWRKFNVDGTRHVLKAAREAGVKRFIHVGTEAALFHGQHLRGVDETYPLAPNSPYPYSATKAQAEQLVRAANAPGFGTIVLRPRFVWGPGDTTLLPAIEAMAKAGKWSWVNGGKNRTSTTHIDNLTHAIELALTNGRGGEAYFVLDDGVRTMHDMISGMAAARGIALPEKSLPSWVADALGATCEFLWRTFPLKGEPPLTRFSAMILSRESVLNDDKARAEMGYRPVISVEDGWKGLAAAR